MTKFKMQTFRKLKTSKQQLRRFLTGCVGLFPTQFWHNIDYGWKCLAQVWAKLFTRRATFEKVFKPRAALIERAKKEKGLHVLRCPIFSTENR